MRKGGMPLGPHFPKASTGPSIMAGLVPAIHALFCCTKDVDARHKAGHDGG
jgi:hypothetical protein